MNERSVNPRNLLTLSIPLVTCVTLVVSHLEHQGYRAIAAGAAVGVLTVISRRRNWVWRLPSLYSCVAGLDYFYRVFGGMEPNTPGLLSSGAYHLPDAVVLVLCVASAAV